MLAQRSSFNFNKDVGWPFSRFHSSIKHLLPPFAVGDDARSEIASRESAKFRAANEFRHLYFIPNPFILAPIRVIEGHSTPSPPFDLIEKESERGSK